MQSWKSTWCMMHILIWCMKLMHWGDQNQRILKIDQENQVLWKFPNLQRT